VKLIPKSSKIPGLRSQENERDPIVHIKLFTPWAGWTWFLTEYDLEQDLAFCFAHDASYPEGAELGSVSIAELRSIKGPFLLEIERDIHFAPQPLSSAKSALLL